MNATVINEEDGPLYRAKYFCDYGYTLVGKEERICNPRADVYDKLDGYYKQVKRNQYSGKSPSCKGTQHDSIH